MNETGSWALFLKGDKKAFSAIFILYHNDLYRYGLKLAGDKELVNDCIQNLFLKLWKNHQNLKPIQNIKPYLLKSLKNHIVDSLELRRTFLPIDNAIEEQFEMKFSPEDFLINEQVQKETRDKVIALLNKLTPGQRHAIYLRYFEDLDFETIALVMDMKVQSVRNTISRGLSVLRDLTMISYFFAMIGRPDFNFTDLI
jgi:RNA polymerase sigma factor (sigma-70 family)